MSTVQSQHHTENWAQPNVEFQQLNVNFQHIKCEVATYPWFAEAHIADIYSSDWVAVEHGLI